MTKKRVRLGVAVAIVGASLALGRPAKAEGDDITTKCECYSSWFGYHGVYQVSTELPVSFCAKADCWVPLEN